MMMMMMVRVFIWSHKWSNWVPQSDPPWPVEQELCGGPQSDQSTRQQSFKKKKSKVTKVPGNKHLRKEAKSGKSTKQQASKET